MGIAVSDGVQAVAPGQTETYTIALANAGPSEIPTPP